MSLYLGIDGGGTKTKVVIIDQNEHIIYENTGSASSIDTVSNDETYLVIKNALSPYFDAHPNHVIDACFAGLGGVVFESDYHVVEDLIRKLPYIKEHAIIQARNDMENALYSGYCFEEGIALISGTGMVAFGKHHDKTHKASGWGYKEGELGSAFHLGTEAIRYLIRAFDARVEKDDFARDIAHIVEMNKTTDIMDVLDRYYDQRTKVASLAPIVTKYANLNHPYAKSIVDQATDECALAIHAVYQQLSLKSPTLVIVGSLGNSDGYFKDQLHKKIKQIDAHMNIIKPLIDPAFAAALMAKKMNPFIQ